VRPLQSARPVRRLDAARRQVPNRVQPMLWPGLALHQVVSAVGPQDLAIARAFDLAFDRALCGRPRSFPTPTGTRRAPALEGVPPSWGLAWCYRQARQRCAHPDWRRRRIRSRWQQSPVPRGDVTRMRPARRRRMNALQVQVFPVRGASPQRTLPVQQAMAGPTQQEPKHRQQTHCGPV